MPSDNEIQFAAAKLGITVDKLKGGAVNSPSYVGVIRELATLETNPKFLNLNTQDQARLKALRDQIAEESL